MPIYSSRLARAMFPDFGRSISGFGLDLLSGVRCAELGGTAIVIDEVVAVHARAIDQGGGAYYRFLRENGINANAELWALAKQHGLPLAITAEPGAQDGGKGTNSTANRAMPSETARSSDGGLP